MFLDGNGFHGNEPQVGLTALSAWVTLLFYQFRYLNEMRKMRKEENEKERQEYETY